MTPAPEALLASQTAAGARFEDTAAGPRVVDYGDPEAEQAALRTGAAIAWRSWRAGLVVGGAERAAFLHRLLTCAVTGLQPGGGTRGLLLDTRGKIQADLDIWAQRDRFLVLSAVGAAVATAQTLSRYVLRSAVEIETGDWTVFGVGGPAAAATLEACTGEAPSDRVCYGATVGGAEITVLRRIPDRAFELITAPEHAATVWSGLLACEAAPRPVGWSASEVLRVECGLPVWGAELSGDEFPQEVGLDAAVDFDKGCYLGQETVARIHYRGRVNRILRGLRLEAPTRAGAALLDGERSAGTISSAALSAELGPIALALVSTKALESGAVLRTVPGGVARPVELPMTPTA